MDIELITAISELTQQLTLSGILLYLLHLERQRGKEDKEAERERGDTAWNAIQEDWQRQREREREISRQDKNGGSGL